MAYVPPALRRKAAGNTSEGATTATSTIADGAVSLEEIDEHFWPTQEGEAPRYASDKHSKTLHDCAAITGKLAYVILFRDANPRWDTDRIIFTKSNLDLLPAALNDSDGQDEKTVKSGTVAGAVKRNGEEPSYRTLGQSCETSPVAIFAQESQSQAGRAYKFNGWYKIEKLTYLEPGSPELVRMLQQKFSMVDKDGNLKHRQREPAAWKQSLSLRWAVVKFTQDMVTEEARGPLEIKHLSDAELAKRSGKKSVNEILAEMRMNKQIA